MEAKDVAPGEDGGMPVWKCGCRLSNTGTTSIFLAVAELEQTVLKERKKRSIPGAITSATNGLFSKEDSAVDKAQRALNQADSCLIFRIPHGIKGSSSSLAKAKAVGVNSSLEEDKAIAARGRAQYSRKVINPLLVLPSLHSCPQKRQGQSLKHQRPKKG